MTDLVRDNPRAVYLTVLGELLELLSSIGAKSPSLSSPTFLTASVIHPTGLNHLCLIDSPENEATEPSQLALQGSSRTHGHCLGGGLGNPNPEGRPTLIRLSVLDDDGGDSGSGHYWIGGLYRFFTLKAERKRDHDKKVQHYHELLKEHAYQEWVKLKPLPLSLLNSIDRKLEFGGKTESLENLYFAVLSLADTTTSDPDKGYYFDAETHLEYYEILQTDLDNLNKWELWEKWRPSEHRGSVADLYRGLRKGIEKHNEKVREFSEWEAKELENMVRKTSLRMDFHNKGTGTFGESINCQNLTNHMDAKSTYYQITLEIKQSQGIGGWLLVWSQMTPFGMGQEYQIAWSQNQKSIENLKESIETLAPERVKKVYPLRESAASIVSAYVVLTHNMEIVIKEVDNGLFESRGRCPSESRIL